jgi:hypothetical protein
MLNLFVLWAAENLLDGITTKQIELYAAYRLRLKAEAVHASIQIPPFVRRDRIAVRRTTPMQSTLKSLRILSGTAVVALVLLAGCSNKAQKALDQAKAQAASTNTAQQIQYIDKNGDMVTTVVQPPVAGQPQNITTTTTPPAPGPPPHATDPVIAPYGSVAPQAGAPVAQAPSGPPAPVSLTVPAGTELAIRINQHISVKSSHSGDSFSGEVVEPVSDQGGVILPKGTPVRGVVAYSHRRGHFKGASILELRLVALTLNGTEYPLDTKDSIRTKKGKGRRTAGFIGGMTGAGMLIGGIASGGVGLAIGGAAGAGAGTVLAGATGNRDLNIPAESIVHFKLADDLVVQQ